ncbi:translation initiation factor eIF-2B subunit delta [Asbolus verrucosus]|uniref:Translation initiation factor eIF2B subunit delta n=1 Tax=Asbolus verrucosus TaxID=1661398 RepID=A0A482W406_ASBVE|nr:translation initiation factor eIF-2B subunit delta [Asbolus verrucosus]
MEKKDLKVNGDGLSKKQRRALKVQEKLKVQNNAVNTKENSPNCQVEKKQESKKSKTAERTEVKPSTQLTEKELRKLEWEKKLAAQKGEDGEKNKGLTKAELRAQRREQQEAQRHAKAATKPEQKPQQEPVELKKPLAANKTPPKKIEKKKHPEMRRLQIVSHLYAEAPLNNTIVNYKNVHPAFVRLGVQYSTKKILGSNARCRALLIAVKCLINDLQTPPKQEFCRYLEQILQSGVDYLQSCRAFAVSMSNALRHFKLKLQEATTLDDSDKKETLLNNINTYISEEIDKAGEAINAHRQKKQFEVIVVDGRPFLEGRQMLQRLAHIGIHCSYVQINAISYVMGLATKVLLGAHALLTNGFVMSRIGTSQVALVAQAYNKPVLVCCETYKFSERGQTDSFVYNELGDGDMLTSVDTLEETSPLIQTRNDSNLQILNLLYDVTPPDLITAVVTELAILPCTSAPVVLRIKPTDLLNFKI